MKLKAEAVAGQADDTNAVDRAIEPARELAEDRIDRAPGGPKKSTVHAAREMLVDQHAEKMAGLSRARPASPKAAPWRAALETPPIVSLRTSCTRRRDGGIVRRAEDGGRIKAVAERRRSPAIPSSQDARKR